MPGYHQSSATGSGSYFFLSGMSQRRGLDKDVRQWCQEQFGPPAANADVEADKAWTMNEMGDVWVKSEDHAFAFKMRWC